VDFLLNQPKGEIKNKAQMKTSLRLKILKPLNEGNFARLKWKNKNLFDKYGIGTSKDDKQLKIIALEKCFNTSASTEFEKFSPEKLKSGRVVLEEILSEWNQNNKDINVVINWTK
jgi:hypothetical protein